jgi:hypothetical protein
MTVLVKAGSNLTNLQTAREPADRQVLSQERVVASGGQTRLRANGEELRPCGPTAESSPSKDVNKEAEESTALVAATKKRLVETQQTEKIVCCSEL